MSELKFKNGTKLSDVMSFLPPGVINKTETGIGATYLEAICKRNSIIVEPLRAIVTDKSKQHNCLGFMSGVSEETVTEYLNLKKDDFRKIFVVSDSVGKLITILNKYEKDVYKNYFYLIDEVEQYQTEAGYRTRMGIAIDYYKEFTACNRAMMTATMYKFSNPLISTEPTTEYSYDVPKKRKITLKCTNNPTLEAIATIKSLEGKTLIYFNSVDGINKIIELGDFKKEDCAVYCGNDSKEKVKALFQEFTNTPNHKYNFFTSAYFSGIDILGDYNIVTIIDATVIHTLLYPCKLKQISGRVRNTVLSDTIISNYTRNLEVRYTDYVESKLKDAYSAIDLIGQTQKLNCDKWFNNIRETIIKQEFDGIKIIREDKDGVVIPNFEEIDYKYIHLRSGTDLYSDSEGLKKYLITHGNDVSYSIINHTFSQEQIIKLNSYKEKVEEEKQEVTKIVYDLIKSEETRGVFNFSAVDFRQLIYESTGTAKKLFSFYYEFRDAEALRKSKGDERLLNDYKVTYSFEKLNSNHTFKKKMDEIFKPNFKFSSEQVTCNVNTINSEEILGCGILNENKAIKYLKRFYTVKRCKIRIGDRRIDGYEIIGGKTV